MSSALCLRPDLYPYLECKEIEWNILIKDVCLLTAALSPREFPATSTLLMELSHYIPGKRYTKRKEALEFAVYCLFMQIRTISGIKYPFDHNFDRVAGLSRLERKHLSEESKLLVDGYINEFRHPEGTMLVGFKASCTKSRKTLAKSRPAGVNFGEFYVTVDLI